jgi:hypothetical protein
VSELGLPAIPPTQLVDCSYSAYHGTGASLAHWASTLAPPRGREAGARVDASNLQEEGGIGSLGSRPGLNASTNCVGGIAGGSRISGYDQPH